MGQISSCLATCNFCKRFFSECLPVFCLEIGGVVGQVRRQQKIKAASKVVVQHKIAKKSINPKIVVGQSHASGT